MPYFVWKLLRVLHECGEIAVSFKNAGINETTRLVRAEAPTNLFLGLRSINVNLSQRQGGAVTHLSRRD